MDTHPDVSVPGSLNAPKLLLIDGMAVLFRSYFAMGKANISLPDGSPCGAVFGFLKIIFKLLKEQNPTHLAVTWDRTEPTFRHELFKEYKGHRKETPSDLIPQIKLIKRLVDEFELPAFSYPGFEGDDCIGTMAKWFEPTGDVFILSADKDFMQLINDKIKMISLKAKDEYVIIDSAGVVEYFGVKPNQVIDMLSILGDASDNIPGVKGIGEKGAGKLMNEYGSLDKIYENISSIPNKSVKEKLEASKEQAYLSRKLATICCDVPMHLSLENARFEWDTFAKNQVVISKLHEMKMFSVAKMMDLSDDSTWPGKPASTGPTDIFGQPITSPALPVVKGAKKPPAPALSEELRASGKEKWGARNYHLVSTTALLDELCARISSPETTVFAIDTETTGLDVIQDRPIGVSLSFVEGEGYYIPAHTVHLGDNQLSNEAKLAEFTEADVWEKLQIALKNRTATAVAHNFKFDIHQFLNCGLEIGDAPVACTMIAAWLIDPTVGGYGLDAQTLKNFQVEKIATKQLIGKGTGRASMTEVPLDILAEYAAEDADATLRLWHVFEKKLKENDLEKLFWDLEMPVMRVLVDMERQGVHIDKKYLDDMRDELQIRIKEIESDIHREVGETFNIASPKQLGAILFEKLKVQEVLNFKGRMQKTTLGFKTDAEVLEQFSEHPVVALVQEFRELSKLLNTYIIVLPSLIKEKTGRVHTQFNQIGTSTGRLSSNDPNLQNIPIRTDWGKKVRAAICAPNSNTVITSADYSQVELRVLAHISKDEGMISAFNRNADIHRETASKILGKPPEEITPEERGRAKVINFGIIYGMGAHRLAREQNIPMAQAKAFIEKYFLNFARIRDYIDTQIGIAHEQGVVKTLLGRPRPVRGIDSANGIERKAAENIAINSPIQGTAADIMKIGMVRAHKSLTENRLKTKILLQVHDELVLEGPKEEAELAAKLVSVAMQGAVSFVVPLSVEVGHGPNWLEAK